MQKSPIKSRNPLNKAHTLAALLLALVLAFGHTPNLVRANPGEPPIKVELNNQEVSFPNQQPIIVDGRTLVPARGIFEHLGFFVEWFDETQMIRLTRGSEEILLQIGYPQFIVDGEMRDLDAPAQIINGSTMIPLRAVADAIGAEVNWDGTQRLATITYNGTREQTQNQQAQVTQTVTWIHFDGTERTAEFIPGVTPMVQVFQLGVGNVYVPEEENRRILDYSRASFQNLLDVGYSFEQALDIFEYAIFDETNRVRAEHGVQPLVWDATLARAARLHSQDMAVNNFLSHTGSDGSHAHERAVRAGYPSHATENASTSSIASTPGGHVHGWMTSPGHRAQMLQLWIHFGGGVWFIVEDGQVIRGAAVQMFGQGNRH